MNNNYSSYLDAYTPRHMFNYIPDEPEQHTDELVTQPDMALTATEVLQRFQRGLTVPTSQPEYTEFEDYSKMNMEELSVVIEELKEHIDAATLTKRNILKVAQEQRNQAEIDKKLASAKKVWDAEQKAKNEQAL